VSLSKKEWSYQGHSYLGYFRKETNRAMAVASSHWKNVIYLWPGRVRSPRTKQIVPISKAQTSRQALTIS